ncbi:hypothetical protein AKO1_012453 [Acrasis kona]|uniref:Uncharacterized protein n=1 Tax=Acrasis kona TaxID=1008807 RepID=A0AAW2YWZ8_9EUKA
MSKWAVLLALLLIVVLVSAGEDITADLSPEDAEVVNSSDMPSDKESDLYALWCRNVLKKSPFTVGSRILSQTFNVGLMLAIFITVTVEIFTHKLEHAITNYVTNEIIFKVYKELMLMGLISFSIIFFEATSFFDIVFSVFRFKTTAESGTELTHRRVKIFELVHIIIFALSIFFLLVVSCTYIMLSLTWKRWERYEKDEMDQKGALLEQCRIFGLKHKDAPLWRKIFDVRLWFGYFNSIDKINYISARTRFIRVNNLRQVFPFALYLKTRIRHLFVRLIEIDFKIWFFLFLVGFVNYLRNQFEKLYDPKALTLVYMLLYGVGSMLACAFMFLYTRIAYEFYVKKISIKAQTRSALNLKSDHVVDLTNNLITDEFTYTDLKTDLDHAVPDVPIVESYDINIGNYMLFRSVDFHFLFLQLCLLSQCFYFAAYTSHFTNMIINENVLKVSLTIRYIVFFIGMIPPALSCICFIPLIVGPFAILTSVDNMSCHELIVYSLEKEHYIKQKSSHGHLSGHNPLRQQLEEEYESHTHQPHIPHHLEYFSYSTNRERARERDLKSIIKELARKKELLESMMRNKSSDEDEVKNRNSQFEDFYYSKDKGANRSSEAPQQTTVEGSGQEKPKSAFEAHYTPRQTSLLGGNASKDDAEYYASF